MNGIQTTTVKTPGKRFAIIPRAVVLHRMETADCLDSRLFWAIILWSWCGVEVSADGSVVLKDEEGWIRKDTKGNPIPAKQDDLREALGLAAGTKGAISRAIARLAEVGSIRFGNTIPGGRGAKVMYPVQEPPLQSRKSELLVQATLVWHIGTRVVSTDNFKHLDEVACTELKAELDDASTEWLSDLKAARTKADRLVVQALSRRGIIIEKSLNSRAVKSAAATAKVEAEVSAAAAAESTPPKPPAEEPLPQPAAFAVVSQELSIDEDAAERLVSGCREVEQSITGQEIVMLARAKLLDARDQIRTGKIANVVGLLINHIPKMCKGAPLQSARQQIEMEKQQHARQVADVRSMWNELSEEERTLLLPKYPELTESTP